MAGRREGKVPRSPSIDGTVTRPDGKKGPLNTDKDGFTAAFEATGRYAAYLRHTEAKPGEHEGKDYLVMTEDDILAVVG